MTKRRRKIAVRSMYDPATKICVGCFAALPNRLRVCWRCDYVFYESQAGMRMKTRKERK